MSFRSIPIGGAQDHYLLHEEQGYTSPFKVVGLFDPRSCQKTDGRGIHRGFDCLFHSDGSFRPHGDGPAQRRRFTVVVTESTGLRIQRQLLGALLHNPGLLPSVKRAGLNLTHLEPALWPILRLLGLGASRVIAAVVRGTDVSETARAAKVLHDMTEPLEPSHAIALVETLIRLSHPGTGTLQLEDGPEDDISSLPDQGCNDGHERPKASPPKCAVMRPTTTPTPPTKTVGKAGRRRSRGEGKPSRDPQSVTKTSYREGWLLSFLGSGRPWPSKDLERRAREHGLLRHDELISRSSPFLDARKKLGVVVTRHGFGRGARYEWSLPDRALSD
jgi:hypothetical protein